MKLKPINSSMLSHAGYSERKHELGVIFHIGGMYIYEDVPRSIYTGLMEADAVGDSVGAYMHKYVIDEYHYRRMSGPGETSPRERLSKKRAQKTTDKGQVSKGKVLPFSEKHDTPSR